MAQLYKSGKTKTLAKDSSTMTRSVFIFVLLLINTYHTNAAGEEYYYWKEYTGVVPFDALPGGHDAHGRPTYIGQGYIHGHGLYIAQIYPGVQEVDVPCYGVKTAPFDIKILCTDHKEHFKWVKTSAKTYEQDTANLTVVVGGYDNIGNSGILPIGRVFYQGIVTVGDVTPYISRKGNVQLWFPYKKIERATNFYEVLTISPYRTEASTTRRTISTTPTSSTY